MLQHLCAHPVCPSPENFPVQTPPRCHWSTALELQVVPEQTDRPTVRLSRSGVGDGVLVTVVQTVLHPGWAYNKLDSVFGEFVCEATFVVQDNIQGFRISSLRALDLVRSPPARWAAAGCD